MTTATATHDELISALREMVMAAGGVGLDAKGRREKAMAKALVVLAKVDAAKVEATEASLSDLSKHFRREA